MEIAVHRPTIMLTCITSATSDYTQPAIMLTFAYLRRPPTTHMEIAVHRPAIMLTLYNFSNLRLHTTGDHVDICIPTATTDYTHGDRRFIDSMTTDYARMEIAVSSTGGHVDLCITSMTTDYTRMEIAFSSTGDHVNLV